jgi:hypothetical protein
VASLVWPESKVTLLAVPFVHGPVLNGLRVVLPSKAAGLGLARTAYASTERHVRTRHRSRGVASSEVAGWLRQALAVRTYGLWLHVWCES